MSKYACYNYVVMKKNEEEYGYIDAIIPSMSYYALMSMILDLGSWSIDSLLECEDVDLDCFGVTNDSFIQKFKGDNWSYVFNDYLCQSIDHLEDIYPQLNYCNSVKLKKENFIELIKQWNQDVLVNKPEFVLLWQDQQYKVYLECFEDEDSVRKRVDEVKRVVGEEEVEG